MRNQGNRKGGAPRGRRESGDNVQEGGKPGRNNFQGQRRFKKHNIGKRDQDRNGRKGGPRNGKRGHDKKNDNRDLDREMRDYWIGQKGNNADVGKYLLRQTLRNWQGRN